MESPWLLPLISHPQSFGKALLINPLVSMTDDVLKYYFFVGRQGMCSLFILCRMAR